VSQPLPPASSRRAAFVRLAILAALVAAAALVAWRAGFFELRDPRSLAAAVRRVRTAPAVAPLFVAVYAVVAAFGLPATPLTLAGGAIFGTALGSLLNWLGAVLGATGSFLLARHLGRDAFRRLVGRLTGGDRLGRLDALGERRGFATLLRLRLLPVVPFNVLSFAAGLAGVTLRAFVAATALGIIPGTIVYTYFADSLLAGVEGASRRAFVRAAVAAGLLLALSFLPPLVRRLRRGGERGLRDERASSTEES
jgi:uncharacterized membrane protein YdjX (TVP38/TMEM64 family)